MQAYKFHIFKYYPDCIFQAATFALVAIRFI